MRCLLPSISVLKYVFKKMRAQVICSRFYQRKRATLKLWNIRPALPQLPQLTFSKTNKKL